MGDAGEKLNCWEYMQCGREFGGSRVEELGTCAAATQAEWDGVHGGTNAGRYCWAITGTLCGGQVQGLYACKMLDCVARCPFYRTVSKQEGLAFTRLIK